ncbi:MAG: ribonuclease HII [Candidatus Aureabacteria bacterium]|nr:ribonuclease HII [Candidatus Auribacterota bacterium]
MNDLSSMTVTQIRERYLDRDGFIPVVEIVLLEADPRAGVRQLAVSMKKHAEAREAERRRIEGMLSRERALWEGGVSYIAGVDEVGVGPFAGPVVAAAVVFPPGAFIEGVRDSKQLTHERRVVLDGEIRKIALAVGVGAVDVEEIDRVNILQANLAAMRCALLNLRMKVQHVLVDGRPIPGIGIPQEAIPGGDAMVFSIAAASIVAKVHRDAIMVEYDSLYPRYGFARHKGYGTTEHLRALEQHGPCAIHRRSFDWRSAIRSL